MAMSSSSMTDSSESLNGLTIGHKIYFEDVGLGVMPKSGTGLSSTVSAQSKKLKAGSGAGLGGSGRQHLQQQPPRCLVEGCNVDLSDVKAYYSRHKVCIMHSKSAVVTVGGVLKRFCQQCSRFHQLSEFDQEKRSCRRRLAGHNERRRKPPPVSLLSSHYGSSLFDTNNQGRGFLLEFSRSSVIPDSRQHAKSSDRQSVLQTQGIGKFLMDPWPNSYGTPQSGHSFHNAGGRTSFPCQQIPPGEHLTGGFSSDSNRALSLLSSEPWGSAKNQAASNQEVLNNSLMNPQNSTFTNLIPSTSWGFNGNESAGTAHKMFSESDLGLGQIPQTVANLYPVEYGVGQQDGRQDIGAELSSRFYESVQQMHWSL